MGFPTMYLMCFTIYQKSFDTHLRECQGCDCANCLIQLSAIFWQYIGQISANLIWAFKLKTFFYKLIEFLYLFIWIFAIQDFLIQNLSNLWAQINQVFNVSIKDRCNTYIIPLSQFCRYISWIFFKLRARKTITKIAIDFSNLTSNFFNSIIIVYGNDAFSPKTVFG